MEGTIDDITKHKVEALLEELPRSERSPNTDVVLVLEALVHTNYLLALVAVKLDRLTELDGYLKHTRTI